MDAPEYENTSHAMLRAISLGIRHLEFDIRMTADSEIVLFHDNVVNVAGQEVPVANVEFKEMKSSKPNIEYFHDFLQSILSATTPDMDLTFVVDVKTDHHDQGFADKIIKVLSETESIHSNASFVITSYDHRLIAEIQSYIGTHGLSWECGLLIYHVPTVVELSTYSCEWIGFDIHTLTDSVVADAHSVGKTVFVYTPNDTHEFDRCVKMNVDGIYTDNVKLYLDHEKM